MSETFDAAARAYAVDPTRNVVLEASAGTGKTRVLVERYVNLLRAGVEPGKILAITFTRKAAAEMRDRIIERLREASRLSEFDRARWRELKDRLGDIAISTIDAFCLSLLREFPLEADVDPGFDLAADTDVPRLMAESLDQALRICRGLARDNQDVALVFAQLGERRLRIGLAALLNRRLVAPQALTRFLARGPRTLTAASICRATAERLADSLRNVPGGTQAWLADGPLSHPQFAMLAADIRTLTAGTLDYDAPDAQAWLRSIVDRLRGYFLTQENKPRNEKFLGTPFNKDDCASEAAWKRHRLAASNIGPAIGEAIQAFRRDLNVILSRGVWRIFSITLDRYRRTLDAHALLDFSGVLERAVKLLRDLDEFGETRFRLESRYQHVLVDEFQDTSRAQWELVAQLVRSWGEGLGASADALPPSIFVVGDRKQSIYGFRDAEVAVLDDAATFIRLLRAEADGDPKRAISVSFRAVPEILSFVNGVCDGVEKLPDRRDAFRYGELDQFPIGEAPAEAGGHVLPADVLPAEAGAPILPVRELPPGALGLIVGASLTECAARIADEIARLLGRALVRDRRTGLARTAQPADIAVLMRARDAHREIEKALERRGISAYVYKGLGFFEAEEVQDAVSLLRYLAEPQSNARAAAFLRSRIVRLSDRALAALAAQGMARAFLTPEPPDCVSAFSDEDRRVFEQVVRALPSWLARVDRLPPADLLNGILAETGYSRELDGIGARQARENLKKLGAIIRRFQNRGYATLSRVAEHLDELAEGDESNAAIDAEASVSLMTVHAAKGLEFPVVFVANIHRGTGNQRAPIRVTNTADDESSVAIADFQSEADEDQTAKDREETKRLLYVALTRARDRLYLAAAVTNGAIKTTRGSLGEVLPRSLKDLFGQVAAGGAESVVWTDASGTVHTLGVTQSLKPEV